MTEQQSDLQDPRGLHRAAEHLTDRDPGFAAEIEARAQALRPDSTAGTVADPRPVPA
ncbi:hypothetical protein ACH9DO_04270 [Kocuria sp. M1N1S27]|uniref:hypothetical protein n=1 Tax=Kocuria kalidii TaxID=3376283 RepID=UPI003793E563